MDEHGLLADNPLFEQLNQACDLLRANPQLGKIVRRGRDVIHRHLLRSGWHLYYRFLADRERIEIVALWYASRGDEPAL